MPIGRQSEQNKKDDHGKGTNAENAEAELGAKGAQEGDEQQEQRKDGKEEDENLMEEEEEDEDGKTAGKEADHIPDEVSFCHVDWALVMMMMVILKYWMWFKIIWSNFDLFNL